MVDSQELDTYVRNRKGQFKTPPYSKKNLEERRHVAAEMHGMDLKTDIDVIEHMNSIITQIEKSDGTLRTKTSTRIVNIKGQRVPVKTINLQEDFAKVYSPLDDFYGSGGSGDAYSDYGRIPSAETMAMSGFRMGAAYRATHGVASDVFRNRFSFVEVDDINKVIARKDIRNWQVKTGFWSDAVQELAFERRSGNGFLVGYWKGDKKREDLQYSPRKAGGTKQPYFFQAFSAQYLFPTNIEDGREKFIDFNKKLWNYSGGILGASYIHRDRVHILETRRVEGNIRGLSILEPCYWSALAYMNTMIFVLKSLAQLGTATVGINSPNPIPTSTEVTKYLDFQELMRANKFYVLGRDAKLIVENAASKIGAGLDSFLEFLREDMSACWIVPKNQLFGRSEGGGLDGAGALVTKEDYLNSCLSTIQLDCTDDLMWIFSDLCGFKDLDNVTLRWNLDLHKTEEQRLKEQIMAEQLEQEKSNTRMTKKQEKLMDYQVVMAERQEALSKIQLQQAQMQFEQIKANPKLLLGNLGPQEQQGKDRVVNEDEEAVPPQQRAKQSPKARTIDFKEIMDLNDIIEQNTKKLNRFKLKRKKM